MHNGLPVVNLVANVNIDKFGKIISSGYVNDKALPSPINRKTSFSAPKITAAEAVAKLADLLKADKNAPVFVNAATKATKKYFLNRAGELELVWDMNVDLNTAW